MKTDDQKFEEMLKRLKGAGIGTGKGVPTKSHRPDNNGNRPIKRKGR